MTFFNHRQGLYNDGCLMHQISLITIIPFVPKLALETSRIFILRDRPVLAIIFSATEKRSAVVGLDERKRGAPVKASWTIIRYGKRQ